MIGKHLATFNVFREPDGLYVTCADATGVRSEVGETIVPLHLLAMKALREALRQMDERAALAAATGTAKTAQRVECEASQSGAEGRRPTLPTPVPHKG